MSINTESSSKVACQRRSFNLAPANSDGIVLSVHHTLIVGQGTSQRVRYLHASFNCTGSALAASNHLGNVYVFDLTVKKYWFLVHVNCSIIKFMRKINTVPRDALFVGATTGDIQIYNSYTCENIANLLGHKNPVNDISFSETDDCVTLATNEAILWNMKTFTKLHVLHLEEGTILKFVRRYHLITININTLILNRSCLYQLVMMFLLVSMMKLFKYGKQKHMIQ